MQSHIGVYRHRKGACAEVDSEFKIPCCTGELNLHQRCAGLTLYQLNYIPTNFALDSSSCHNRERSVNVVNWSVSVGPIVKKVCRVCHAGFTSMEFAQLFMYWDIVQNSLNSDKSI